MTNDPTRDLQFKLILVGDGAVGKTSLRRNYLGEGFKKSHLATIGVDFAQKFVHYGGVTVRMIIWDVAGQPTFESIRRHYYAGTSGLLFVYSVIDRDSFHNASRWFLEASKHMTELPPTAIIGNKVDLRPLRHRREIVTSEEGKQFAEYFTDKLGVPSIFWETSALTGQNVDSMFSNVIDHMRKFRPE
ncbi:MAG: Rab family GTPase [Candidatus Thorarchaeota archaeon]